MTRGPLTERICAWGTLGFGGWTLSCQLVVLLGGSLYVLLAVVALALTGLLVWSWRSGPRRVETPASSSGVEPATGSLLALGVAAVLVATASTVYSAGASMTWAWGVVVLALGLALASSVRWIPESRNRRGASPVASVTSEGSLLLLAATSALLAVLAHRASLDDAFYVNVVVHVAQEPGRALLARDTIFGIAGMPIQLPIYRLHSIEVLGGAVSWLTGLRPILAMHVVVAALAGFALPLAQALFFRTLLPARWLTLTAISSVLLLAWGGSHFSYGNFALVHLFQGKAILAAVMMPLLIAYTARFARRGDRHSWLLLMAAVVGSVGMSWIALALAPMVVALTLLAHLRRERETLRRLLVGAATLLYPIVVGVVVLLAVHAHPVQWEEIGDADAFMRQTLHAVVGDGSFLLAAIALALVAWATARDRRSAVVLLLIPLGFLLTLFLPWLVPIVAHELGDTSVYPRVFWMVPIPLWTAAGIGVLGVVADRLGRPRLGTPAMLFATAVGLGLLAPTWTTSRANDTHLGLGGPNVIHPEYEMARLLVRDTPEGERVLAPPSVAAWVTTFRRHPYPIFSRHIYMPFLEWMVGEKDAVRRQSLSRNADGAGRMSLPQLRQAVADYDLGGVCIKQDTGNAATMVLALRRLGFERAGGKRPYSVWVRSGDTP